MARIRDIRHEELTQAAIRAVHEHGLAQVTMTEIARAANASAASINYYFGSKDRLMEATMRHLLGILHDATLNRYATASGPRARLEAVVAANFDDRLFTPAQCSVWTQFWSQAPYAAPLARLQRINRARVRSNLGAELRQLVPAPRRDRLRETLQAYMDGIWLQAAQEPVPAAKAREDALSVLTDLLEG